MTTHGAPARSEVWHHEQDGAPTLAWFVRRSVLWVAIVISAVALACALYAVASKAQSVPSKPAVTAAVLR